MMIRAIGLSSLPVSSTGSQIASPKTITVADVVRTPTSGKSVIVVGRPRVWPIACSRWLRPNRVKSGMFRDRVDQKAIMPMSEIGKIFQKSGPQPSLPGSSTTGPRPPACQIIQTMRPRKTTIRNGAAQFSNFLIASMPQTTMIMLRAQKMAKLSHRVHGWAAASPMPIEIVAAPVHPTASPVSVLSSAPTTANSAVPPIQVWMPNQPQATKARISAGRLAPYVPNDARAMTGYGMPVLGARVADRQHRDQDEDVGQEDREQRLVPGHPERDQAGGQQPRRDVDRHADPQGQVVVGGPGPLLDRDRGQVLVVEPRAFQRRVDLGQELHAPVGPHDLFLYRHRIRLPPQLSLSG